MYYSFQLFILLIFFSDHKNQNEFNVENFFIPIKSYISEFVVQMVIEQKLLSNYVPETLKGSPFESKYFY